MSVNVGSKQAIHITDESRPYNEIMLKNMGVRKFITHFAGFFLFALGIFVASQTESSITIVKVGSVVILGLLAVLSFIPWIRDLLKR